MHIQISLQDGIPIYRQIVNQVKYMAASGQLLPEEELPPIRILAKQLLVTPNTVVKAYRELEVEGVVYKRRGAGTYVSEFMSPLARKERRKILASRVDALLAEARQMDFSFDDVLDLLRKRRSALWKSVSEEDDRVGKCG
jgi:GntR family transcriptional regulator